MYVFVCVFVCLHIHTDAYICVCERHLLRCGSASQGISSCVMAIQPHTRHESHLIIHIKAHAFVGYQS
jgi:hypothetical protein